MEKLYLTKNEGDALSCNYGYKQAWIHPVMIGAANSSYILSRYASNSPDNQAIILDILIHLRRFGFASRKHLMDILTLHSLSSENLDFILDFCLENHIINGFTLATYPITPVPADAFIVYCLNYNGMPIIRAHYSDSYEGWLSSDVIRNTEQVVKTLSTAQLCIKLFKLRGATIRDFETLVDVNNGRRMIRFSAAFNIMNGMTRIPFILESVRKYDMTDYWRRKVSDQISPFLHHKRWQGLTFSEPTFVLIVEHEDMLLDVAEKFYRLTGRSGFRLITDDMILANPDAIQFYKYVPNQSDPDGMGSVQIVTPAIFNKE